MATIVLYDPTDTDVPNRVTHLLTSVHTPDYSGVTDKLVNPDLSSVVGQPTKYWKRDGTDVVLMSGAEQTLVDFVDPFQGEIFAPQQYVRPAESYMKNETKTIVLPVEINNPIVYGYCPDCLVLTNGNLVSPSGTGWDPGSKSTLEANINNGNFGDLVYNNSAAGNTSGIIFGIDMGAPTAITAMKKYDYSATYYDTEWEFIGTNDPTGATYDVIFTVTQDSARLAGNPTFETFPTENYQYFGYRCVSSNNASYTIVTELELYTGTATLVEKEVGKAEEFEYFVVDVSNGTTTLHITNKDKDRDIKLVIIGEVING